MGWDGSGAFTRTNGTQTGATTWANADAAGNNITTSQHDTHDEDLADGIGACLTKNNESKPTADFKPNADDSYSLGSAALRWVNIFCKALKLKTGSTHVGTIQSTNLTADRTFELPDAAGSLVIASSIAGHISGLVQSTAVDDDHDTTISAGVAVDATAAYVMKLSSAITKQIDAAWAVGTNQGGLDTGTVQADTWYYLWLIARSDTGVVDVLYSASSSAPTMPTNYSYKRLIGAVKTDGSANILLYFAFETAGGGLSVEYAVSSVTTLDYDSTLTTSPQTITVNAPGAAFAGLLVSLNIRATDAAANWNAIVSAVGLVPSATAAPLCTISGVTGASAAANVRLRLLGESITAESTLASIDSFRVCTLGFEWSRR